MTVAMTEATVDMEAEMVTLVLRQMMSDVVQHAGTPWKMTVVTTAEVVVAEVAVAVADGVDLAVVARNGPAMTAVGVG